MGLNPLKEVGNLTGSIVTGGTKNNVFGGGSTLAPSADTSGWVQNSSGGYTKPSTIQVKPQTQSISDMINQSYADVLGRTPDAEGFKYWEGRLASGLSPTKLKNEIANIGANFDANGYEGTVDQGVLRNSIVNAKNYLANLNKQPATTPSPSSPFQQPPITGGLGGLAQGGGFSNADQVASTTAQQNAADRLKADNNFQDMRLQTMQTQMPQYQGIFNPSPSSAKGTSAKGAPPQVAPVRNSSSMKGA